MFDNKLGWRKEGRTVLMLMFLPLPFPTWQLVAWGRVRSPSSSFRTSKYSLCPPAFTQNWAMFWLVKGIIFLSGGILMTLNCANKTGELNVTNRSFCFLLSFGGISSHPVLHYNVVMCHTSLSEKYWLIDYLSIILSVLHISSWVSPPQKNKSGGEFKHLYPHGTPLSHDLDRPNCVCACVLQLCGRIWSNHRGFLPQAGCHWWGDLLTGYPWHSWPRGVQVCNLRKEWECRYFFECCI